MRFRACIYVDVWADSEDKARLEAEEIASNIPNSYVGELEDIDASKRKAKQIMQKYDPVTP